MLWGKLCSRHHQAPETLAQRYVLQEARVSCELHDTVGRLVDLRQWHILQVTGTPKALREYTLQGQSATGGLNGCWKIYTAKAKKEGGMSLAISVNVTRKHGASALLNSIIDSAFPH